MNRILSCGVLQSVRARWRARCIATTVLPVPAPPVTRAGPLKDLATSRSWLGCRKTRHFSSGASRIAVSSSSDWIVTNRRRESGCWRAAARSEVSTAGLVVAGHRLPHGFRGLAFGQPDEGLGSLGRQMLAQRDEFLGVPTALTAGRRISGTPNESRRRRPGHRRAPVALRRSPRLGPPAEPPRPEDLQGTGAGIDLERPPPGPLHRVVVVVHPEQDVDVALVRVHHHGPVLLVDPTVRTYWSLCPWSRS